MVFIVNCRRCFFFQSEDIVKEGCLFHLGTGFSEPLLPDLQLRFPSAGSALSEDTTKALWPLAFASTIGKVALVGVIRGNVLWCLSTFSLKEESKPYEAGLWPTMDTVSSPLGEAQLVPHCHSLNCLSLTEALQIGSSSHWPKEI